MEELKKVSSSSSLSHPKEQLDWTEELEAISDLKPTAKYGAVSEALRHAIPEKQTCKGFCGGKKCKYCNVDNVGKWPKEQMEIEGLFSNWVTDNILAMARPVTSNVKKFEILNQFKEKGIKSVINLQLSGEHLNCGNGLEPGGFSYNQQEFMDNGVFYYNFGWQDYGVGSLTNILDMVKVMQFALSEGKVAVHCHAGLGRTGVMIATYLVFTNGMDPYGAIHYVRSKRKGAIQTSSQIECIHNFAKFLLPLRQIFHVSSDSSSFDFTLPQFLIRQKQVLHGYEARNLKYIPKIICVCCERLLQMARRGNGYSCESSISQVIKSSSSSLSLMSNLTHSKSTNSLLSLSSEVSGSQSSISQMKSVKSSVSLESFSAVSAVSKKGSRSPLRSHLSVISTASEGSSASADSSEGVSSRTEAVARSLAETEYSAQVVEAIHNYMVELNGDWHTFEKLASEKDPTVLAGLVWEWLDHLKEPVLHSQDLPNILDFATDPLSGLNLLEKGARFTLLYLSQVVARLEPLPESLELDLVQRLLSTLTHQNIVLEYHPLTSSSEDCVQRTKNATGFMRDNVASKLIFFFSHLVHISCCFIHEGSRSSQDKTSSKSSGGKKSRKNVRNGKIRPRDSDEEDEECVTE